MNSIYSEVLVVFLLACLVLALAGPLYLLWKIVSAIRHLLTETDRLSHNLNRLTETIAGAVKTVPASTEPGNAAPEQPVAATPATVLPKQSVAVGTSCATMTPLAPDAPTAPPPLPSSARTAQPPRPGVSEPPTPLAPQAGFPTTALTSDQQPGSQKSATTPATATATPAPPARPRQSKPWEVTARKRLRQCWNWFLCGQADGPGEQPMEKIAATAWLLRAGICVILFTVGFMLKMSIHQGWLAPAGRVALAFAAGAALLFWSLRLLNGAYRLIGQATLGLSLATFYFGAFAATGMYSLVSPILGFALMAAITAGAGFMAVRFEAIAVAIIAMVGGYATPVLLDTGSKNFPALFAYMLILGVGVLAMAACRDWLPLNWLGMFFTYFLFIGAWNAHYTTDDFPVLMTAAAVFFGQYSTVVFIHNVARQQPSSTIEVMALLVNATVFTGCGYRLIATVTADRLWFAPLTLALAAFYIGHAFWFLRRKHHDRGLLLAFIGLGALFLTLTVPLVLAREWLVATWALLALLMLWLGQNLNSAFLRSAAWLLYAVAIGRLTCFDFFTAFGKPASTADLAQFWRQFAERLIQFTVPLASLAAAARLACRPAAPGDLALPPECDLKPRTPALPFPPVAIAVLLAAGLFFLYCHVETARTVGCLFPPLRLPALTMLWLVGAIVIFQLSTLHRHPGWTKLLLALVVALIGKIIFWDFLSWSPRGALRYALFSWTDAAMRLADFGPLIAFLIFIGIVLRGRDRALSRLAALTWPALLFLYTTWELNTMLHHLVPKLRAGGISVLWGVFATAFIYRGLTTSQRWLRWLGLALFALVVGKVFLYDLARLGNIHRVFAFLLFGLLLMAGAFFYLRFWQNDRSEPAQTKDD